MRRILMAVVLGLGCAACGGIDSYEGGMEAQMGIMEDMMDVLEGVTDQASAKAAAPKIEALGERMAELAVKIQKLPQPKMEELQELMQAQAKRSQDYQQKMATQMMKLGEYPELSQAFARAMASAK